MPLQSIDRRIILTFAVVALVGTTSISGQVLVDHTCTNLDAIPGAWIARAADELHIAYDHTSHGSHITSGMDALAGFPTFEDTYAWSIDGSHGLELIDRGIPCDSSDLSQGDSIDAHGVTPWVTCTRTFLDDPANAHINVIMWSWCSINAHDAQRYVDNMEILVSEYPAVDFVFMTGHAQGQGEYSSLGNVHYNNELIREHCRTNERILFDFADIEAYDPDGDYFWDLDMWDNLDYTSGNWAVEWIAANPGTELERLTTGSGVNRYSGLSYCAHSDSPPEATLNCILKGRAVWWLFARLAGWDPEVLPVPRRPSGRVSPDGDSVSKFRRDHVRQ